MQSQRSRSISPPTSTRSRSRSKSPGNHHHVTLNAKASGSGHANVSITHHHHCCSCRGHGGHEATATGQITCDEAADDLSRMTSNVPAKWTPRIQRIFCCCCPNPDRQQDKEFDDVRYSYAKK